MRYEPIDPGPLLVVARNVAMHRTQGKCSVELTASPPNALWDLGWWLARDHGLGEPEAALLHRNAPLGYHRDTKNPYPCVNLVVFFRHDMDGGELHFPDTDETVPCEDGHLAIFDGQRLHGMTGLRPKHRQAWRISTNFYCPA